VQLLHPLTREGDIFHHAVFAHELGHVAVEMPVDARDNAELGGPEQTNDAPAASTQSEEGAEPADEEEDEPRLTFADRALQDHPMPEDLKSREQSQLSDWFRELACDIFAMRLIGPAFAIAFAEVTAPNRPLEPDRKENERSHPPADLRFAVLKEELAEYDLGEFAEELAPILDSYLDSYPQDVQPPRIAPSARPWLTEALTQFRDDTVLGELLDGKGLDKEQLKTDLPLIFELADRDIPPCERLVVFEGSITPGATTTGAETATAPGGQTSAWSTPLEWRSVLNGMLLWHLRVFGRPPENLGADIAYFRKRSEHRRKAVAFALAAVELSEFHTRASSLRHELRYMKPVSLERDRD
jgi:hypothetical protein